MRTDIFLTIKKTLEDVQNITVLSMDVQDNIVFGIYITEVRDNLSFLSLPKRHFETTIDGINIQFFELGAVLHKVYAYGALKFIDILCPNDDIIKPHSYYIDLYNLVMENLPFNIAKLKYIEAHRQYLDNGTGVESVSMLMDIALMLNQKLSLWYNDCMDNFLYVENIETENDIIKACNSLNGFKVWLESKSFAKISEKNMNKIDQMYINLQILHMKV